MSAGFRMAGGAYPFRLSVRTDRREGQEEIGPFHTACPSCGIEGNATKEINRCDNCRVWFRVIL